ncbi:secondary thiamine-phosphate synthase enzyme YjbQ [Aliikangiella coralliicola]|uniref:YjbQ family protein n=1 Tax=Aliikangiella coralliicola TaxID=2592383 RepID=A0A545TW71_9GAMM|nr:secondary thiamine-phosphate synthase enzyme YjbQ [Aliikangiella coralliicola]TQV81452.1 YjbQ family protein [Aliikangiella coralliicola]
MIKRITVKTRGQGLYEFTDKVRKCLSEVNINSGLCTLFVRHTSCSMIIQENADSTAKDDLENWLNRLVPEGDSLYTHTFEGRDDMPAHIKSVLTATHLAVPFDNQALLLGTWQGVYLWEHRHAPHSREIVVHFS